MTLAHRLSCAQGRRDQGPNKRLAAELAGRGDEAGVAELVELSDAGTLRQRRDAILVLHAVGERRPELLAPHLDELVDLLEDDDNRMLWSVLLTVRTVTGVAPVGVMEYLGPILDAAERSSVIARDATVKMLVELAAEADPYEVVAPHLLRLVRTAATNQFPTYATRAAGCLRDDDLPQLVALIEARDDLDAFPAKRRNMDKLLRRIAKRIG